MDDFYDFLRRMGGMHDSVVERLVWRPSEKKIEFHFEDMYSNFVGLPDYPGQESGAIILSGISALVISVESEGPLRVFEFLPDEQNSDAVVVTFCPGGMLRARFKHAIVEYQINKRRGGQ